MQTLRQQVHSALKEKILRREMRPGQQLVERELAAELGVSRTPVRECLLLLQMEGLADNFPGLGVVVRDISVRELREALAVRRALDVLAAQEACYHHADEDLVLLEAAVRSHELAVQSQDEGRIAQADSQFHARVYEAAHNSVLTSMRSAFALYESFYFHADVYRYTPEAFMRSLERHRQLCRAIAARNAAAAEEAAALHVQEAAALTRGDDREQPRRAAPLRVAESSSPASRRSRAARHHERR